MDVVITKLMRLLMVPGTKIQSKNVRKLLMENVSLFSELFAIVTKQELIYIRETLWNHCLSLFVCLIENADTDIILAYSWPATRF